VEPAEPGLRAVGSPGLSVVPLQYLLLVFAGLGESPPMRGPRVPPGGEPTILREQLGGRRLRFTDAQRRRLAAKAKALGGRVLDQLGGLVTPDTILRSSSGARTRSTESGTLGKSRSGMPTAQCS
jgi:hypothetical protein